MPARYSAKQVFEIIKPHELADEKVMAIEQAPTDSPTLVVAGAGSGKTELLTLRVLWLVANELARPEQILGLTFTKKAATELQKRIFEALIKLRASELWPEGLEWDFQPPNISTYNSFANQIFRDSALALGYESESKLLGEASSYLLAREVVLRFGTEVAGSLSDLEMNLDPLIERVISLCAAMNDHGASASAIAEVVKETIQQLISLPKKVGQEPTQRFGYIEEIIQALSPTALIAELAQALQQEKRNRSLVDYSDQVALATRAVAELPEVRAELRARFSQVLLDEYQDTSVLQTKLLSKLFANSSVFAVGDPNQSIYGWRGASATNLDDFKNDFGSAKLFPLRTSWRNPTTVLDLANRLAAPLTTPPSFELGTPNKERVIPVALEPKPDAIDGEVSFVFEQTIEQEADAVASFLAPAVAASKSCAVLMRKRSAMRLFVERLQDQGLSVEVVGLGGLMELPEIVDLVCALKVIQRADSGAELIRLLTGARFRIGVKDIDRLNQIANRLSGPREEGVFRTQLSLVEALDAVTSSSLEMLSEFDGESLTRLRTAASLFANLRSATALPLADFVRMVAEELWLDIELQANPKLRNPLAHLEAFYEIVSGYSSASASASLGAFLDWLDYAAERDRFEIPKLNPGAGVVQVLTIHAAKGLEWDYVAVPNLVEDDFPAKARSVTGWLGGAELPFPLRGDSASLPSFDLSGCETQADAKAAKEKFRSDYREHQLREELRLGYVAMTRSASALMLSGSYWKPGNLKARKPSQFLLELAPENWSIPPLESDLNPLDQNPKTEIWPLDPLSASQREKLERVARNVQEEIIVIGGAADREYSGAVHEQIDLLLAEQDERIRRANLVMLPVRIPASKFKDFVLDVSEQARRYQRPLPQQPYRATRMGTLFHSWVEEFLVQENSNPAPMSLKQLSEIFQNSRFSNQPALDVELEINLTQGVNTFVCKLDAVFAKGDRYEIVDWKTGAAPKTEQQKAAMTLQLALYRFAYSKLRGIPIEQIDLCFYFVADNTELVPDSVPAPAELIKLWSELFSA